MDGDADPGTLTAEIIDSFGGIRPMATKLVVPVTTVQGWKKRGIIPQLRHPDILAAAVRESIAIDPVKLAATDPVPARPELRPVEPRIDPEPMPVSVAPIPAKPEPAPPRRETVPKIETVIVRKNGAVAYAAFTLALIVGAAVAGAGFVGWRYYLQPLQAKVAMLEARPAVAGNDDLARRVVKLESGTVPPAAASGSPPADGDRLAALERQLAELKAGSAQTEQIAKGLSDLQIANGGRELLAQSIRDIQSSTAATQGELDRLGAQVVGFTGRLDKVDAALAERHQEALRAEATVLTVGQLRTALATSKPYAKEVGAVRVMVLGDADMLAALDQIQPYADTGVETSDDLGKDFSRRAPALVRGAVVGDGQSWWRQALYHLESIISIRRVGDDVPGDSTEALVARAEAKLDGDDLPGAIAVLQGLTGASAEMASPWIHDAAHRVTVDNAESDLNRIAISRVSTGKLTGAGAAPAGDAK